MSELVSPKHSLRAVPPDSKARANIEDLAVLIWSRRAVFLTVALLSVVLILSWSFVATPVYRVAVNLTPRQGDDDTGGGIQSVLGQLSAPAELLGLNVHLQVNEQEAIALLKSRALFLDFVGRESLMPELFPKAWDPAANRWRRDVKRLPTMDDAWTLFDRKIRSVDEDKETGIVTLQITWRNRQQAASWANDLVRLANEELRQRALTDAEATLGSLQEQLDQTKSMELRDSIYRLMEVQINKEVLAKARPDYAFTVLDPAVAPDADKFVSPKRGLAFLIAVPLALILGAIAAITVDGFVDFFETMRRRLRSIPK